MLGRVMGWLSVGGGAMGWLSVGEGDGVVK